MRRKVGRRLRLQICTKWIVSSASRSGLLPRPEFVSSVFCVHQEIIHSGIYLLVGMVRKVVAKDGFVFSDGTVIPHGAILSVPIIEVHRDPGRLMPYVQIFRPALSSDCDSSLS